MIVLSFFVSAGLFLPTTKIFAADTSSSQTTFTGVDGTYTNTIPVNGGADVALNPVLSNAGGSGWQYKRPITITNSSGGPLTDYQVQVNPFTDSSFINNTGLVGSWHMSGGTSGSIANGTTAGLEDLSGNSNNGGAANPNGTGMAWAAGKFGGATSFDGVDDYINVGNASTLGSLSTITAEAWVNFSDTSAHKVIVSKDGSYAWALRLNGNSKLDFMVTVGVTQYLTEASVPTVGSWHHVAGTYDGETTYLYLDGVQVGSNTNPSGLISGDTTAVNIGRSSGYGRYFNGQIDEVKIYNRALSATELSKRYGTAGVPKVRGDYADLRFTSSATGVECPYWQETDGKYWVKVNNLPNGTNTSFLNMYYGNVGAQDSSNKSNTFSAYDDFNRADNTTLGSVWTEQVGDLAINGNVLSAPNTGESVVLQTAVTPLDNYIEFKNVLKGAAPNVYPLSRMQDEDANGVRDSYYAVWYGPNAATIYRRNNGAWSAQLAAGAAGTGLITTNDVLAISVTGTNPVVVKGYKNDVEIISYSDSTASRLSSGGYSGLRFVENTSGPNKVDNFGVRNFSASIPIHSTPGVESTGNPTSGTYLSSVAPSIVAHQGKVYAWGNLTFTNALAGQSISYDIIDSATGNAITGYTGITASPTSLAGISTAAYPALKIRANLSGDGNTSPALNDWTIAYTYDTVAPTITNFFINSGAASTTSANVTLALTATDTDSGVSQMQFSNDGITWSGYEAYATSKAWTLSAGDGTKQVQVRVKDAVGNVAKYTTASSTSPVADWQAMTQGNHYGNFYDNVTGTWAAVTRAGAKTIYDPSTQKIYDVPANQLGVNPRTAELVTNGTFDTDTMWTKGTGWTISNGAARFTTTGAYSNVTQNILYTGDTYRITLDVTISAGTLYVKAGSTSTQFLTISSSGSYTIDSTCAGSTELTIQANPTFSGTVDNVTAKNLKGPGGSEAVIEESRTNYVLHSDAESGTTGWGKTWTNDSTLTDVTAGPGIVHGVHAIEVTSATTNASGIQNNVGTLSASTQYTGSAYITYISGDKSKLKFVASDGMGTRATVDIGNSLIQNVPVRVTLTWTSSTSPSTNIVVFNSGVLSSPCVYRIDAAQIELGAFSTSYISTTTTTVTRAADVVTVPTTGWNNISGTFIETVGSTVAGAGRGMLEWRQATAGWDSLLCLERTSINTYRLQTRSGGVTNPVATTTSLVPPATSAFVYGVGAAKAYVNSSPGVQVGSWVSPTGMASMASIGRADYWTAQYNGPISRLLTYSSVLSDADVLSVTNAVKDGAGSIVLDSSAPVISSFSINNNAQFTNSANVSLALTATNDGGSAGMQMQFSNDGQTWSNYEAYVPTKSWTLSAGDGTKQVQVRVKDAVGNVATYTTASSVSPVADWQAMTQGNHYGNFYDNVTGQWATVTRAGAKTIYDPATSKIYDVPANYLGVNPRSDGKGGSEAVIEEARTNYLKNSYFNLDSNSDGLGDSWANQSTSVTGSILNSRTSDAVYGTSQSLQYTGVSTDSPSKALRLGQASAIGTFVPGENATGSFWYKGSLSVGVTTHQVALLAYNSSQTYLGAVTATINPSNTWQKATLSYALPANTSYVGIQFYLDGLDDGDVVDVKISAVQLEKGAFATSYIPTSTTTVARNADIVTVPTTGWNSASGAISMVSGPSMINGVRGATKFLWGGTDAALDAIVMLLDTSSNHTLLMRSGGGASTYTGVGVSAGTTASAFSYTDGQKIIGAVNGVAVSSSPSNFVTPIGLKTTAKIAAGSWWQQMFNGPTSRLVAYPSALSSTDVATVSTNTLAGSGTIIFEAASPVVSTSTITSPNGSEKWQGDSSQNITWNPAGVTDDGAGFGATPIKLEYTTDGTNYTQIATNEANDGTYAWNPVASLSSATVKIRITATDRAGNTATDVSDANFTVDSTGPTAPTGVGVTIGTVTANTISLSWSVATDSISGLAGYEVYRAPDNVGIPGSWVSATGTCSGLLTGTSCTESGLSPNTRYYFRVRAKDNTGNYSSYFGEQTADAITVGLWNFNEGTGTTTADASGNGNAGTLSIGATGSQSNVSQAWGNGASGRFGGAMNFDGSDDYVDMGTSSTLGVTQMSIESWVYLKSYHPDTNVGQVIAGSYQATGYIFYLQGSGAKLGLRLHGGTGVNDARSTEDLALNTWYHVVGTYDGTTIKVFVNGVQKASAAYANPIGRNSLIVGKASWSNNDYFNGKIDGLRLSNVARTATEIANSYAGGYISSNTLTSTPVLDIPTEHTNVNKPAVSNFNAPDMTFTNKQIKLYDNGTLVATTIANGSGVFTFATGDYTSALTDGEHTNLTVKALNTDGVESAASNAVTIHVDTSKPIQPTAVQAFTDGTKGTAITDNDWSGHNNQASIYVRWTGMNDGSMPPNSGVRRYYVYIGSDANALPRTDGQVTANTDNETLKTLTNPITGTDYYVRVQTEDYAGNISDDSLVTTLYTYKYDDVAPTNVDTVSVNPVTWSELDSFNFTWAGGVDSTAGMGGYQYKRDVETDDWSATTTDLFVTGIKKYQSGVNYLLIRTVDRAGNSPATPISWPYLYSGSVAKPQGLAVDLSQSSGGSVNNVKFTWGPPLIGNIVGYYYSINDAPNPENATYTTNAYTDFGPYAKTNGVANTFYVVAKDEYGNIGWNTPEQVSFIINTVAPNVPAGIGIIDASDRATENWALTINWTPLVSPPVGFDGYEVWRCEATQDTDCATEADYTDKRATVNTNIYSEANLNNTSDFHYMIKSRDNTGNTSGFSIPVNKIPTGKFIQAPSLTSGPTVFTKALSAEIAWTTNRVSNSIIQYGTTTNYTDNAGEFSVYTTDHSYELSGLLPGTTYHYRVQSLDRGELVGYSEDMAYTSDATFTTSAAPGISSVETTEIRLTTAIITWKTTSSATSKILYGTTSAYGQEYIDNSGSQTTTHTVQLTGLSDSTTYNFKIQGTDVDGNTLVSDNYVFTTLTYPKISNLRVEQVKSSATSTVRVSFDTNVSTTAQVTVGNKEVSDYSLKTSRSFTISGLADNTTYTVTARARDEYGNEADSISQPYKTEFDTRPPAVTNVTTESSIVGTGAESKTQVIISWETDEAGTSQIEYAFGTFGDGYTLKTQEDTSLTTSHVVILSGLKPSTAYHFRTVSRDAATNTGYSEDNSVLTEQLSMSVLDLIVNSLESSLGWLLGAFSR